MSHEIRSVGAQSLPPLPQIKPGGTSAAPSEFKQMLLDSLEQVSSMQQDADRAVESLMTGGDTTPGEVLTAVQKADIAFRMMMQMRNKLVQAYDEVKQIRV